MNNGKKIESNVLRSCRIENFGAGYYSKLSDRYSNKQELSEIFKTFSKHELKHGAMFSTYYQKEYGKKINSSLWYSLGKISAFLQFLIPLRLKLKILCRVETAAVKQIKNELRRMKCGRYPEILEKILSDEIVHAELYGKLYPV